MDSPPEREAGSRRAALDPRGGQGHVRGLWPAGRARGRGRRRRRGSPRGGRTARASGRAPGRSSSRSGSGGGGRARAPRRRPGPSRSPRGAPRPRGGGGRGSSPRSSAGSPCAPRSPPRSRRGAGRGGRSSPIPRRAETNAALGYWASSAERSPRSSSTSTLLNTMSVGFSRAPSSLRVWLTTSMCSSKFGWLASTTWRSASDSRSSSSVLLKLSMSLCGSFRMNPTVSERRMLLFASRSIWRVVASSVANSRFSARTPASASAFMSVLLPALV
jgi:hypothetical protein